MTGWPTDGARTPLAILAQHMTTENVYTDPSPVMSATTCGRSRFRSATPTPTWPPGRRAQQSPCLPTVVSSEPAPGEQPHRTAAFTGRAEPGVGGSRIRRRELLGLRTSTIGDGGSPVTGYTVQWPTGNRGEVLLRSGRSGRFRDLFTIDASSGTDPGQDSQGALDYDDAATCLRPSSRPKPWATAPNAFDNRGEVTYRRHGRERAAATAVADRHGNLPRSTSDIRDQPIRVLDNDSDPGDERSDVCFD